MCIPRRLVWHPASVVDGSGSSSGGSSTPDGSAPSTPTKIGSFSLCSLGQTHAEVQGRGSVLMREVQVGDRVLVGHDTYSPVYGFGRLDTTNEHDYWQVHTQPVKRK